ncbi:unnamed protein product [Rotaria socialis]|uniref:Uncharacterized protein n=1 Tax=Rotaria socialis TaxID=392032 RepID=A0A818A6D2_9BILA|nr:unnamed protein product [Rotaria socialis]CAF3359448.1 unnamed protein product [Rotaria socialis]CAF3396914.1 unnamed protein product [Rotaria socialis]CAF3400737.1 unnamed protein product [Rotaria socialis]CAF3413600.1 unnamed protein product [Rotaria socialis]
MISFFILIIYYVKLSNTFTVISEPFPHANEQSISTESNSIVLQIPPPPVYLETTTESTSIPLDHERYSNNDSNLQTKSATLNRLKLKSLFAMILPGPTKMNPLILNRNQSPLLLLIWYQ